MTTRTPQPKHASRRATPSGLSFRTRIIWGALAASMVAVTGGLSLLGGPSNAGAAGRVFTPLATIDARGGGMESAVQAEAPLDRDRWKAIVIHDSGAPADSPTSIDERHRRSGLASLGYHFVIGNGARMGDGNVHTGQRWLAQQPGAHVAGREGPRYNESAIGICLVGDGDRRRTTDAQMRALVRLVAELAAEFEIPRDQIYLHSDLAPTTSPGRLFPASVFFEQIAWLP